MSEKDTDHKHSSSLDELELQRRRRQGLPTPPTPGPEEALDLTSRAITRSATSRPAPDPPRRARHRRLYTVPLVRYAIATAGVLAALAIGLAATQNLSLLAGTHRPDTASRTRQAHAGSDQARAPRIPLPHTQPTATHHRPHPRQRAPTIQYASDTQTTSPPATPTETTSQTTTQSANTTLPATTPSNPSPPPTSAPPSHTPAYGPHGALMPGHSPDG
jgi:hypothetical protein